MVAQVLVGQARWLLREKEPEWLVSDVNVEIGEETVRMIQGTNGECILLQADMLESAEIEEMIGRAIGAYGRLDYAFNSAGVVSSEECSN